ncbi:MAG: aldo/keto reductase [Phycisphaeraceae bacterium]|nr:aldo/keto reductase [Phycisphaeraceae bacterium]
MKYRRMGRTGLKMSEISLGSWITYGGTTPDDQAISCIHRAFDLGINLFDTADVYARGEAERVLGRAVQGLPREQLIIATKCRSRMWDGPLGEGVSRKHIVEAVEASLRRMKIDYIDLYQVHAVDTETPIDETLRAMDLLARQGKILYVGCSNFSAVQLCDANHLARERQWFRFDCVQPHYNMLNRTIEPDLLPHCGDTGVGVIVYCPLAQGVLTGKYNGGRTPPGSRAALAKGNWRGRYLNAALIRRLKAIARFATLKKKTMSQVALAWILRRPEVTSCIIGASSPKQVEENVRAVDVTLNERDLEQLEEILE